MIDYPAGSILSGIEANPDVDRLYKSAQANGAPKPQTPQADYLLADRVDHTRPLLDQPVTEVELYDPTS